MSQQEKPSQGREGLRIWGLVILLTVAGVVVTLQFVEPPPPRSIVLATGSEDGAYHAFGIEYRDRLAEDGLEVELRVTAGSIENLRLLEAGEVDVAFVQGGTVPRPAPPELTGLASLFHEPLWVFLRRGLEVALLADLQGKRIQVGAEGSGTRAVALELLGQNGITEASAELSGLDPRTAAEQILAGELDALFLVAAPRARTVHVLMEREGDAVTLLDLRRASTYERMYRYLRTATVSEGLFDLERDIPAREKRLVAPTAQLVARSDLHHALVPLLLEVAEETHFRGDLFESEGQFPSPLAVDVPLGKTARQYFKSGRSFLYRVLPFRLAAALDRLKILLLPLLTLLLPLIRVAPPLYRWRIRSRITRWYKLIGLLEARGRSARTAEERAAVLAELAGMREDIRSVKVPAGYMEECYNLRMHLDLVIESLNRDVL